MTETTVLNAAGGLIVAGISKNFEEGVETASNTTQRRKSFCIIRKVCRGYWKYFKIKGRLLHNGKKYLKKISK